MVKAALLQNGSPEPLFETDEARTWFSVILKPHPAFQAEGVADRSPASPLAGLRDGIRSLVFTLPDGATNQATNQVTIQAAALATDEALLGQFENLSKESQASCKPIHDASASSIDSLLAAAATCRIPSAAALDRLDDRLEQEKRILFIGFDDLDLLVTKKKRLLNCWK
jgi:Cdc6-like AAA superfamily ATPase